MKLTGNVELSDRGDETGSVLTSVVCSAGLLLCMVFAIFGIKFRWFKHRLSFQQLPDTSHASGGTSGTNSENGGVVPLQGVFRRREDADAFVEIERPKTLPPIRIRSTDVQIPIPNRLSQITPTHTSSRAENTNQPPNPPPMPNSSSSASLNQNRAERSNRSQASSSRSKSSERSKKSDEQTTSAKSASSSTSSRKKKGSGDAKAKPPIDAINPQYSEVNKKRREKDKDNKDKGKEGKEKEKSKKQAAGVTFEPRKPKKHSDQTRHFEKLKDDRPNAKVASERRPTGFIRPNEEEMEVLEKLASMEEMGNLPAADGVSDNDEENQAIFEKVKAKPVPEPRKRVSNENAAAAVSSIPTPPPVASVASKPADSWSAVARHRILTEELTKQHSALKPVNMESRSNGTGEFRNPLSASMTSSSGDSNKPRTMRDMKKSKDIMSHNDRVVLGQEQPRDDTEA